MFGHSSTAPIRRPWSCGFSSDLPLPQQELERFPTSDFALAISLLEPEIFACSSSVPTLSWSLQFSCLRDHRSERFLEFAPSVPVFAVSGECPPVR